MEFVKRFYQNSRKHRKKLIKSVVLSAVITAIGGAISYNMRSDESPFLDYVLGLNRLELLVAIIYPIIVAAILYGWERLIDTDDISYHQEIPTGHLLQVSRDSMIVVYTSYLPDFEDWYKPELINYLLKSSPILKGKKNQTAIRFFIASRLDWREAISDKVLNSCIKNLANIHEQIGIQAFAIDTEDFVDVIDNREDIDFCIGYANCTHLTDILNGSDFSSTIVVPIVKHLKNLKEHIEFKTIKISSPNQEDFVFYNKLAKSLVAYVLDENGNFDTYKKLIERIGEW